MDSCEKLRDCVDHCLLPKLTKNLDETETHPEYGIRQNYLEQHFHRLLDLITNSDFINHTETITLISNIMILNEELRSEGPWNTEKCKTYSQKLNYTFDMIHGTSLDNLLQSNVYNSQGVFDECIKYLHQKITSNSYRYYPSLIEVYCALVLNIKAYSISINPITTLPISLLLIDDWLTINKVKGLKCCGTLLQCLKPDDFAQGNYYEVIYESLKKCVTEKDVEVTKLVLENLLLLLRILPVDAKKSKIDKIFAIIVEQLYVESNLYRKAVCFKFIKSIIQMHGINCVNRKHFKVLMWDNIDICSNDAVADILLMDVLECLETWIKHCWCVYRLSSDQKSLSNLFKILYVCKDKDIIPKVQKIILTLISLCTKEEQKQIKDCLEMPLQLPNTEFLQRMKIIIKEIHV